MSKTEIPVGDVVPSGSQKLLMLRDATQRFGVIAELQAVNLRTWPRIFLKSGPIVMEYHHEERRVEYQIETIGTKGKQTDDGYLTLDKAVKWLLGLDITIRVIHRGKIAYENGPEDEQWLSQTSTTKTLPSTKTGKKKRTAPASRSR